MSVTACLRFPNGSYESIAGIAIALKQTDEDQFHTGILYRPTEGGPIEVFHLGWHHDLRRHEPRGFAWVEPAIKPEKQALIEEFCDLVHDRHAKGGLPYGFDIADAKFREDAELLVGPTSHGLTCATFVMLVFERCGIILLDTPSWRPRKSDKRWRKRIIDALKRQAQETIDTSKRQKLEAHVNALEAESPAGRYRPSELAAGSMMTQQPGQFIPSLHWGKKLERALREWGPQT